LMGYEKDIQRRINDSASLMAEAVRDKVQQAFRAGTVKGLEHAAEIAEKESCRKCALRIRSFLKDFQGDID